MARFGWRVPTPTPTPTDAWSSYFDSWKTEDKEVPTTLGYEPMILDDDLYLDSINVKFNIDFELDWEMDFQDTNLYEYEYSTTKLRGVSNSRRCNKGGHDVNRHARVARFQGPTGGARNELRRDRERARISHEYPGYHAYHDAYRGRYGGRYEDVDGDHPPESLNDHAYPCAYRAQHNNRVSAVTTRPRSLILCFPPPTKLRQRLRRLAPFLALHHHFTQLISPFHSQLIPYEYFRLPYYSAGNQFLLCSYSSTSIRFHLIPNLICLPSFPSPTTLSISPSPAFLPNSTKSRCNNPLALVKTCARYHSILAAHSSGLHLHRRLFIIASRDLDHSTVPAFPRLPRNCSAT